MLSRQRPPPLTPALFAGLLLRPLPVALLQAPAGAMLRAVLRRHPGVVERLVGLDGRSLLLDPTDLPVHILLRFEADGPTLRLLGPPEGARATVDAVIHGPLLTLVDLLEGRIDGDALFFSRRLEVEGDMDVVVALRNALDGAAIDLGEALAARFGSLERPAVRAARLARALIERMSADLDLVAAAANAGLGARLDAHDAAIRRVEQAARSGAPSSVAQSGGGRPRRAAPP